MAEREYLLSSTKGVTLWTEEPLIFRFHGNGHLWIGTDEKGGIASLSPTKAAALIDFLSQGGDHDRPE